MLRAVGIPSRVVIGYQGGEYNSITETYTVRQFDAHAWVEYWVSGSGWVRLDPTASVAPSRISMGMQGSLASEDDIEVPFYSPLYYRNLSALKYLRQRMDVLNYEWQRLVVNFDQRQQSNVLETLLGKVTPMRTATFVIFSMLLSGLLIALRMIWQARSNKDPAFIKDLAHFKRKLEKLGVKRQKGEAIGSFVTRSSLALPAYRREIEEIGRLFEQVAYANSDQATQLRMRIRRFKPQISAK
jgi:hypothetical protein